MSFKPVSLLDRTNDLSSLFDEQLRIKWPICLHDQLDTSLVELENCTTLLEQRRAVYRDTIETAMAQAEQQAWEVTSHFQGTLTASHGRVSHALDQATQDLRMYEERTIANCEHLQQETARVDAEEETAMAALELDVTTLESTSFTSIDTLIAEREKTITEKICRLKTELKEVSQELQVLCSTMTSLEENVSDLQTHQDQMSEALSSTQSQLESLSQKIAETERAWEQKQAQAQQLLQALVIAVAGSMIGIAAASAWQASGHLALGVAAGDAAAGSSVSIGLKLTGDGLLLSTAAGGVTTAAVAIAASDKEKGGKKENKPPQEKTAPEPQSPDPEEKLFPFPSQDKLQHCLEQSPMISNTRNFRDNDLPKKIAAFFADSEMLETGIQFGVNQILEDSMGRYSPIIQNVFTDAIKKCTVSEPQPPPPADDLFFFSPEEPLRRCLEKSPKIPKIPYFQNHRITERTAAFFADSEILEIGLHNGLSQVLEDTIGRDSPVIREVFTNALKQCVIKKESRPSLPQEKPAPPFQPPIPKGDLLYFPRERRLESCLREWTRFPSKLYLPEPGLFKKVASSFADSTKWEKEIFLEVGHILKDEVGKASPLVQKAFFDGLKRCITKREQQSSLPEEVAQGHIVNKVHHRYGKTSALTLDTIIESIKEELHSQENPVRDRLVSGGMHVGIAEALGSPYWLMIGIHAVGHAADSLLPRVQHFLKTQDPDWHASAIPDEMKGVLIDLYQAAILAELALHLASAPSHALHAVHQELTTWATQGFNTVGITDHNIAEFFTTLSKHISEEDMLP